MQEKSWTESVKLAWEKVGEKIEALLREGNVRRVVVKQDGQTIAEFPLTIGVVGAAIVPPVAAIAAIAAIVTECTVEVERINKEDAPKTIEAPQKVLAPVQTGETIQPVAIAEPAADAAVTP